MFTKISTARLKDEGHPAVPPSREYPNRSQLPRRFFSKNAATRFIR